jgi:HEAT repeat protein
MKVQSVLADVQALRRSNKTLAPRALVAQDCIEPLPQEELDEALIGRDKAMQLAVLQVAQHRDPPLLPTMLELLRQGDKDVRAAAMAALPQRLPEDLVPQLRGIATEGATDVAIAGLSALGRVPMTDEVELFLAEQGARSELPVARAALAALANRGVRLAADTSHQLWQLVGDPNCDRGIMARAFLCLEQTKSSTAGEALAQAASLDEFGRYFAARIAISAGDQGGIEMMLSLCDGSDKQVRFAARGLLAGLAKSPASAEETWRAFFAGSTWTTVGALPKPLLDL